MEESRPWGLPQDEFETLLARVSIPALKKLYEAYCTTFSTVMACLDLGQVGDREVTLNVAQLQGANAFVKLLEGYNDELHGNKDS